MSRKKQAEQPKTPLANQQVQVDYTSKEATLAYYNGFDHWNFHVCMGDCKTPELVEVKDNLVVKDGEYYLPAPKSNFTESFAKADAIADGKYYAYVFKKVEYDFRERERLNLSYSNTPVKCTYNVFHLYNGYKAMDMNPSIELLRELKPNNTEITVRPSSWDGEFTLEYTQSGRDGLSIDFVQLRNFGLLFKRRYLCERFNHGVQTVFPPDGFISRLEYSNNLVERINEVLKAALNANRYRIDDSESWGEYSLHYIEIEAGYCNQIFALIANELKSMTL